MGRNEFSVEPILSLGDKKIFDEEELVFYNSINEQLLNSTPDDAYDELCLLISKYIDIESLQIYDFNLETESFNLKLYIDEDIPKKSFKLEGNPLLSGAFFHQKVIIEDTDQLSIFLKVREIPIIFMRIIVNEGYHDIDESIELIEKIVHFTGKILEHNLYFNSLERRESKFLTKTEFQTQLKNSKKREKLFNMSYRFDHHHMKHSEYYNLKDKIEEKTNETDLLFYSMEEEVIYMLSPCQEKDSSCNHIDKIITLFKDKKIL